MNTLNERIKKVRKALDLTQQEFADKLSIKRNTVATYEAGKSNPSDAAVILICKTFNISETWLRTGEGEMFVKRTEEDELAQVFSAISASDDELIKRIIRAYWKLDDREKATVKKLIDGFTSDDSSPAAPAAAPAHTPTAEEAARAKAEAYYRQLLLEEEQPGESSASQSDTLNDTEKMA